MKRFTAAHTRRYGLDNLFPKVHFGPTMLVWGLELVGIAIVLYPFHSHSFAIALAVRLAVFG